MGAVQFIENLDRTLLTISDIDFERNVEAAVSAIVERHGQEVPCPKSYRMAEKSETSEPENRPQHSGDTEYMIARRPISSDAENSDHILKSNGTDDSRVVSGLLRTMQKPLSSISRIFSEEPSPQPSPGLSPRLSPAVFQPPRKGSDERRLYEEPKGKLIQGQTQPKNIAAEDVAVQQASAEAAEAQRIQKVQHHDAVEFVTF